MVLDANQLGYQGLNDKVRELTGEITIENCFGERFIASSATSDKTITINGTPGNALGCYMDGATVIVNGNAQDAVGDTMNDGRIIVRGNAGDALGYAMRGGKMFIKGKSGYRTGIHMKQYKEKCPVIIIGEKAGSFLGEYLAGGIIIVLGMNEDGSFMDGVPTGNFTGTGMHGGEIFLRSSKKPEDLPVQVAVKEATKEDLERVRPHLEEYAGSFSMDLDRILNEQFYLLTPNAKNPYKQLYTEN